MSKIQVVSLLIAVLLLATVLVTACGSTPTQAPSQPDTGATVAPAPDGEQLLTSRCGGCHSVNESRRQSLTREQWDTLVTRMIGRGARLTDAEKTVLVDYLAETYGP